MFVTEHLFTNYVCVHNYKHICTKQLCTQIHQIDILRNHWKYNDDIQHMCIYVPLVCFNTCLLMYLFL